MTAATLAVSAEEHAIAIVTATDAIAVGARSRFLTGFALTILAATCKFGRRDSLLVEYRRLRTHYSKEQCFAAIALEPVARNPVCALSY
ncbi:MAG: hypothetical protein OXE94_00715 [Aestuariivita sp.]|nr:hypothetical protein [Aestuariivita sp.]MCY4201078.1 hypothetical protein [Aestuariivita sp.]MCY4287057.1 hypothetical protein [Aestuariivita sp.]MCY4345210.1 hypothetical protein [Aestuariivita sp.]